MGDERTEEGGGMRIKVGGKLTTERRRGKQAIEIMGGKGERKEIKDKEKGRSKL